VAWLAVLGPRATSVAGAQTLMRLHVRSLVLSADPQRLKVGDTLRLVMRAHVDERVARLDNVTLPDLSGFMVLGDERRCVPARRGTDCIETIGLSPTVAGTRTIAPVTLDAIDAKTGRPSRFASNPVRVSVVAGANMAAPSAVSAQLGGARRVALIVALIAAAIGALVWGFARVRSRPTPPKPVPAPVIELPASADETARLEDLLATLEGAPTRANVLAVRSCLRERIGARENETLVDLVKRDVVRPGDPLSEALPQIERAAFVEDREVADAIGEALPSLRAIEETLRAAPPSGIMGAWPRARE
jgi:hypothetical protein